MAKNAPRVTTQGELPDFLTPAECARLARVRDYDLAQAHDRALARYRIQQGAVADFTRMRVELSRTLTQADWIAIRDANVYVATETVAAVRRAMDLSKFLSTPTGAPKSVGDLVKDLASASADRAQKAVVDGSAAEFERQMQAPAQALDRALRSYLENTFRLQKLTTLNEGMAEMRRIRETTLPELEASVASYQAAARDAAAEVRALNDDVALIDRAMAKACR